MMRMSICCGLSTTNGHFMCLLLAFKFDRKQEDKHSMCIMGFMERMFCGLVILFFFSQMAYAGKCKMQAFQAYFMLTIVTHAALLWSIVVCRAAKGHLYGLGQANMCVCGIHHRLVLVTSADLSRNFQSLHKDQEAFTSFPVTSEWKPRQWVKRLE